MMFDGSKNISMPNKNEIKAGGEGHEYNTKQ